MSTSRQETNILSSRNLITEGDLIDKSLSHSILVASLKSRLEVLLESIKQKPETDDAQAIETEIKSMLNLIEATNQRIGKLE